MVTLAVLPGMLRTSLVVADLANPGNFSRAINLLVSQLGFVGLNSSLQQGKQLSAEISAPAGHPRCVLLSVLRGSI